MAALDFPNSPTVGQVATLTEMDPAGGRLGVETRDFYFHNRACYDQWAGRVAVQPA
jgi:hypothetical protein